MILLLQSTTQEAEWQRIFDKLLEHVRANKEPPFTFTVQDPNIVFRTKSRKDKRWSLFNPENKKEMISITEQPPFWDVFV